MGISPGNLYYHFANKDEIVTAALDRLITAVHAAWAVSSGGELAVDRLEHGLGRTLAALEDHRFAAREVFSLGLHTNGVRDRCRELVDALALHLGHALEPLGEDHAPESGASAIRGPWLRTLVPILLSWGSLNDLCPVEPERREVAEVADAAALARLMRSLYRSALRAATSGVPIGASVGG